MSESRQKVGTTGDVKEGHIDDGFPEFETADTRTCLKRRDRFKHALSQFDNDMQVYKADMFKYAHDERMLSGISDAVLVALNNLTHEYVGMTATISLQEDLCPEFEDRKKAVNETLEKIQDCIDEIQSPVKADTAKADEPLLKATSKRSTCKSKRFSKATYVEAAVYSAQKAVDLEYFEKEQKLQAELRLLQLQKEQEKAVRKAKVTLELESDYSQSSGSSEQAVRSRDNVARYMKSINDEPPQGLPVPATEPQGARLNPEKLDSTQENLLKVLIDQSYLNRIPVVEPPVFSGDPLTYAEWKKSFTTLVEQRAIRQEDRMHYLKRYLSGNALRCV